MYCFNCGNKIEDNFAYCPWCGTRMQGKAPAVGSGGGTHRTGENGGKTAGSAASDFVISGGTLEKYIGESQKVRIPANVRAIGEYAFKATMVVSVHIPDGVIKIGQGAFSGCSMLTDVNIPDAVTEIGWGAFLGCSSLKSLSIPRGRTAVSIRTSAFSGCTSLTEVCIDADISKLDSGAFEDCGALRRFTLSGNIEKFDFYVFGGCTSLTEVVISGSCKEVYGSYGSYGIRSLVRVSLPQGLETIGDYAFRGCESLKNINIPESVTCIKEEAFKGCTSLVAVNIPNRNISIEKEAFFDCTSLRSFNCANAALIDRYRFKNTPVGEANGICSYCGYKIGIFGKCTECKKPRKYT